MKLSKINLDLRSKTILPPLVYKVRHITNDQDTRSAELELLHALLKIETVIKHLRAEIQQMEQRGEDTSSARSKVKSAQHLHKIVKLIGSVIPWNYLENYEISALARNLPSGFISGKDGFGSEFQLFRNGFDKEKNVVILNDLTHCLTVGDAVIIHKDGSADLAEVKSGKSTCLRNPQKKRMAKAVEYMHTGVCEYRGKIVLSKSYYLITHNWGALKSVLKDAKKTGFAIKHPEASLTYVAFKSKHPKVEKRIDEFLRTDPIITRYEPVRACFLSDTIEYSDNIRHVPPVTVFKINDKLLLDLLRGELDVVTFFSPFHPSLSKRLAKHDLSLSLINEDQLANHHNVKNWRAITTDTNGKNRYLACKYQNIGKLVLVDHSAIKLLYTFETESSFLKSLIQLGSEFSHFDAAELIDGSIEGSKTLEPAKQFLRSWIGKLARIR